MADHTANALFAQGLRQSSGRSSRQRRFADHSDSSPDRSKSPRTRRQGQRRQHRSLREEKSQHANYSGNSIEFPSLSAAQQLEHSYSDARSRDSSADTSRTGTDAEDSEDEILRATIAQMGHVDLNDTEAMIAAAQAAALDTIRQADEASARRFEKKRRKAEKKARKERRRLKRSQDSDASAVTTDSQSAAATPRQQLPTHVLESHNDSGASLSGGGRGGVGGQKGERGERGYVPKSSPRENSKSTVVMVEMKRSSSARSTGSLRSENSDSSPNHSGARISGNGRGKVSSRRAVVTSSAAKRKKTTKRKKRGHRRTDSEMSATSASDSEFSSIFPDGWSGYEDESEPGSQLNYAAYSGIAEPQPRSQSPRKAYNAALNGGSTSRLSSGVADMNSVRSQGDPDQPGLRQAVESASAAYLRKELASWQSAGPGHEEPEEVLVPMTEEEEREREEFLQLQEQEAAEARAQEDEKKGDVPDGTTADFVATDHINTAGNPDDDVHEDQLAEALTSSGLHLTDEEISKYAAMSPETRKRKLKRRIRKQKRRNWVDAMLKSLDMTREDAKQPKKVHEVMDRLAKAHEDSSWSGVSKLESLESKDEYAKQRAFLLHCLPEDERERYELLPQENVVGPLEEVRRQMSQDKLAERQMSRGLTQTQFLVNEVNESAMNRPFLTVIILVAQIAMFMVTLSKGDFEMEDVKVNPLIGPAPSAVDSAGGNHGLAVVDDGEWYRLLSALFISSGVMHLVINVLLWMGFAWRMEIWMGPSRFVYILVMSGLSGTLLSCLLSPAVVGASGSAPLIGLMGALLGDHAHNHARIRHGKCYFVNILLGWAVLLGFGVTPIVDSWSHVGAFVAGILCGLVAYSSPKNQQGKVTNVWHESRLARVSLSLHLVLLLVGLGLLWSETLPGGTVHLCQLDKAPNDATG